MTAAKQQLQSVSLSAPLVETALALGIDIPKACERGLTDAVQQAQTAQWQAENRRALDSSNAYIDKNGAPLARFRHL